MSALGALHLGLLAAVVLSGIVGLVASAEVPAVLRATSAWGPSSRHRALVAAGTGPAVLVVVAVASVFLSPLLALAWPAFDHCLLHDDHHAHLCFVHLPDGAGSGASWLLLVVTLAWATAAALAWGMDLLRAARLSERTRRAARLEPAHGAFVLPTDEPLCLSMGLFEPVVLVSEGLLARSSHRHVEVMLAHERAHGARRDALVRLLVGAASSILLPPMRQALLEALELAAEQACDEEAAAHVGDRLFVAETILTIERLFARVMPARATSAAFGNGSVPARVESLLEPARGPHRVFPLVVAMAATAVALLVAHDSIHHATESLLGVFAH